MEVHGATALDLDETIEIGLGAEEDAFPKWVKLEIAEGPTRKIEAAAILSRRDDPGRHDEAGNHD